jgi:hypothetical protein
MTPNGIDALIQAHHKYAGGDSQILHADPDLYIMQRVGYKDDQVDQPGLIYVLNNLGDQSSGTSVKTKWPNQRFAPIAWMDTACMARWLTRMNAQTMRRGTRSSLLRRGGLRSMLRCRGYPPADIPLKHLFPAVYDFKMIAKSSF